MKIAKPLLLVLTPLGVAVGLYHGYRVAGGLVVLMAAMLLLVGVAVATIVMTVRTAPRGRSGRPAGRSIRAHVRIARRPHEA
jgi:hypothetical protein